MRIEHRCCNTKILTLVWNIVKVFPGGDLGVRLDWNGFLLLVFIWKGDDTKGVLRKDHLSFNQMQKKTEQKFRRANITQIFCCLLLHFTKWFQPFLTDQNQYGKLTSTARNFDIINHYFYMLIQTRVCSPRREHMYTPQFILAPIHCGYLLSNNHMSSQRGFAQFK